MPRKYLDAANMNPSTATKTPRKTERSHAENQERAYIAASRRADRSIEARVQSARMASEIHKKRTGKAFHITEEIVVKEEMYEEEEEDFPRSYRLLGPHMQTSSAEMNSRVETYLTNRVAMSKLMSASEQDWRDNAVNRAFAETFPDANRHAQNLTQRWSTPGYPGPVSQQPPRLQSPPSPSFDANFQPINYGSGNGQDERSKSFSGVSPSDLETDNKLSPQAATPNSASHPQTPQSHAPSAFGSIMTSNLMNYGSEESAFTNELPAEAKMLMGGGMDFNSSTPNMYTQDWFSNNASIFNYPLPESTKAGDGKNGRDAHSGLFDESMGSMEWDSAPQSNPGEEPSWDTFLNDTWTNEQQ
ncbi:hypothetical protein AK830_g10843 [Neonectria ditissima]|uniref:Uncharacterized protein n=1 Tax=Neonectria ditissima TaxID=78410 RepID=A0A0P7B5D2_9HYPO|nr:hypothetical protein AK830_g10843 [Neonectria ditissima]